MCFRGERRNLCECECVCSVYITWLIAPFLYITYFPAGLAQILFRLDSMIRSPPTPSAHIIRRRRGDHYFYLSPLTFDVKRIDIMLLIVDDGRVS